MAELSDQSVYIVIVRADLEGRWWASVDSPAGREGTALGRTPANAVRGAVGLLPDSDETQRLSGEGIASGSGPVPKSHLFGPAALSSDKNARALDQIHSKTEDS